MAKTSSQKRPARKGRAQTAKAKAKKRSWRRRLFMWPLRWAFRGALFLALFSVVWVLSYRVIPPPINYYMLSEWVRLGDISRDWTPLDRISPDLARAAMAAEDANFCAHRGFDLDAIQAAIEANREGRRLRGGSTISQQVAKNVFLWPARSWLRKGLEAGFTILIEVMWPKRRILEVYLNVAEFDEGVFGAEAAARHYFGRSAADLSRAQASRLAAILPDPKGRSAASPGNWTARRARQIAGGAETLRQDGRAACIAG